MAPNGVWIKTGSFWTRWGGPPGAGWPPEVLPVESMKLPVLVRTPNFPGNASVPLPPAAAGAAGATLASLDKNSGQMAPDGIIMVPDGIIMVPDGINAFYLKPMVFIII